MKTLLSIAVGLVILFSNIIALAAPSQPIRAKMVNYTVFNQTTQDLSYSLYQLPALKRRVHGINFPPGSPTTQLPVVDRNSQQSFMYGMAPGNSYLTYGYDQNHFCKFQINIQNNVVTTNVAETQNLQCHIVVSGGNQVTIKISEMKGTPVYYNVTVVNESSIPFNYSKFQAPPGMSASYQPDPLNAGGNPPGGAPNSTISFSIPLIHGDSYLTYAYYSDPNFRYDPANACRVLFRLDGMSKLFKVKQGKNVQCELKVSGNNIVLNIITTYTIIIQNNAIIPALKMSLPLKFHTYNFSGATNPSLPLQDIEENGVQVVKTVLRPGDYLTIKEGISKNNYCILRISYPVGAHNIRIGTASGGNGSYNNLTCEGTFTLHNYTITLTVVLTGWHRSMFCVKYLPQLLPIPPSERTAAESGAGDVVNNMIHLNFAGVGSGVTGGGGGITEVGAVWNPQMNPAGGPDLPALPPSPQTPSSIDVQVTTDGTSSNASISANQQQCFYYYKNAAITTTIDSLIGGIVSDVMTPTEYKFSVSSLRDGAMQQGLINGVAIKIDNIGDVFPYGYAPLPDTSNFRPGNSVTIHVG